MANDQHDNAQTDREALTRYGRDYMREEWLAWQDFVEALETDFGITREQFNDVGHTTVKAALYWHHMKARLEDSINTRDQARDSVDESEQKGSDDAR